MTRIIAVTNQKGGVGKTTTAVNLGAALALEGSPTLLIDLDPQASMTSSLGQDPYQLELDIKSVLTSSEVPMHRATMRIERNLYLLPGSVALPGGPLAEDEPPVIEQGRLRHLLYRYRLPFDFVLIDTPPTLGQLTLNALVAAGEILVPVQCQYLAMRGVRALFEKVRRLRQEANPQLALTGVVATMFEPGSQHDEEVVAELRATLGAERVRAIIERETSVAEATVAGRPLVHLYPNSSATQAYRSLAKELRNERF
ncbi:MAG: ParA family protein [Acidobacteriota bacterium]